MPAFDVHVVRSSYDFWIADQWSLGAEARAMVISGNRQFFDSLIGTIEDRGSSFELLFTVLYH